MRKSDLTPRAIFRAKDPEKTNYQIWPDKFKQVFKFARVTSLKPQYISSKKRIVTYVYFVPFNSWGHIDGLVSCRTLSEFKAEFKHLKFNK